MAFFTHVVKERVMSENMSLEEMKARYPDCWVLIADPVVEDDSLEVRSGRVVLASRDRDEIGRKSIDLKLPDSAVYYFGQIPDDLVLIL